jgi:hypothetical protein
MAKRAGRKTSGEAPEVALGTSFFKQQYLFAFASQPEVRRHLRTQLIPDEAPRTQEILEAWANVQPRVQALVAAEPNIADTISAENVPQDSAQQIEAMLDNDLLRKSFELQTSDAPTVLFSRDRKALDTHGAVVYLGNTGSAKSRRAFCFSPTSKAGPRPAGLNAGEGRSILRAR